MISEMFITQTSTWITLEITESETVDITLKFLHKILLTLYQLLKILNMISTLLYPFVNLWFLKTHSKVVILFIDITQKSMETILEIMHKLKLIQLILMV